jgi:hypothetical protein
LLSKYSFGKIDLSRSGYKYKNEALKCIHYSIIGLKEPEKIKEVEEPYLYGSFCGGLSFAVPTILENGKLIDINSFYLSELQSDKFTFPLTSGKFVYYSELPTDYFKYGIYHCIIHKSNNPLINRLFYFNKRNYYTHYCMTTAKELGLSIELIKNEEFNALLYEERGSGRNYFNQTINNLYDIKIKMKNDGVSYEAPNKILQCMFGVLSKKNKQYSKMNETFDLGKKNIIGSSIIKRGTRHIVSYLNKGDYFKYSFGRIGTFLTAKCRRELYRIILPYNSNIYRVYTDSILFDADKIDINVAFSDKIGEFKIESYKTAEGIKKDCIGSVEIKQFKKPIWL